MDVVQPLGELQMVGVDAEQVVDFDGCYHHGHRCISAWP
jgi:hypothetical protein